MPGFSFGILHCIVVGTVVALVVRGLHPLVLVALAAVTGLLPTFAAHPDFNAPGLLWLGLATRSTDH